MKKPLLIFSLLGITILALGVAGYAYAQSQTLNPEHPFDSTWMREIGPGHGHMSGGYDHAGMMGFHGEHVEMHESMLNALAEQTDLSVDEIEARHAAGETLWDIALEAGLSENEIQELMFSAREAALEEALAKGWISAEHVEWMNEHMGQMWAGNFGYEDGHCGSRVRIPGHFHWQDGDDN